MLTEYLRTTTRAVTGYHIVASDGEIGHVKVFIVDDETWTIRYLEVDTRNWWPGKKALVSPSWIDRVSWTDSTVYVDLDSAPITREYETALLALPPRALLVTIVHIWLLASEK